MTYVLLLVMLTQGTSAASLSPCALSDRSRWSQAITPPGSVRSVEAELRDIRSELDEIRKVLAALRPGPPTDAVVPKGPISIANSPVMGDSKAELVMIEFSDFECPFCGKYARETLPSVRKDFVDAGLLRYVFRDFPLEHLHPNALRAAVAADCAARSGRFWEMHDALLADQQSLRPTDLASHAARLGLDAAQFARCSSADTETLIRKRAADARALGVSMTPTFIVGRADPEGNVQPIRLISGAYPYSVFKKLLEELAQTAP